MKGNIFMNSNHSKRIFMFLLLFLSSACIISGKEVNNIQNPDHQATTKPDEIIIPLKDEDVSPTRAVVIESPQILISKEVILVDNVNQVATIGQLDKNPNGLKWSQDGSKFLVSSCNSSSILYSSSTLRGLSMFRDVSCPLDCDISPDETMVAFSQGPNIRVYDIQTENLIKEFIGETDYVTAIAISPDSSKLAAGGDTHIIVWDLDTEEELLRLSCDFNVLEELEFSSDGKHLISGGQGSPSLRIWHLENGEEIFNNGDRKRNTFGLSLSTDGGILLYTTGTSVNVLNMETLETIHLLEGHNDSVYSVDISPSGNIIVSGDKNGNIFFWKANTGEKLFEISLSHYSNDLVFSPDGKIIAYNPGGDQVYFLGIP
jgi:WD40 repeat protein